MVNYVAKYITAEALDERLERRKRYFTSRGLKKPYETRIEKDIAVLLEQLPKDRIIYRNVYSSDYGQETEYINFDLGQGTNACALLQLNN